MLEIGPQQAPPSDRWSFSSGQYPSGRCPKVSIGIMVEKCAKPASGPRNEHASVLPPGSKSFSCLGAGETTRPGIIDTLERNKSDVADHMTPAWFSSRSVRAETPMEETVKCFVNSASVLQSEDVGHKKTYTLSYGKRKEKGGDAERVEEVTFATVQEFVDKGSAREEPERSFNFNEKGVNTVSFGTRLEKDGYVGGMEEIAFSTRQFFGEEKGKEPEVLGELNNEALRMGLWEILGAAPDENKHTTDSPKIMEYRESLNFTQIRENQKDNVARAKLNSPNLEENEKNLNINQSKEYKKGKHAKIKPNSRQLEQEKENFNIHQLEQEKENFNIYQDGGFQKRKTARTKQNSDTIETDSESPNQVARRPITRSLARKKAPPKRMQKLQDNSSHEKRPLSSSSSDFKLRVEGKNVFAFDEVEEQAGSFDHTSSGHSNRYKEQDNLKVKLRKVHFSRSVLEKSLQKSGRQPSLVSPNKASPQSKKNGSSSVSSQEKKQFLQMQDGTRNHNHRSQRDEQPSFDSPPQSCNRGTRENTDNPLFNMKPHSWEHENSPPLQKNVFLHEDVNCPSVGRETDPLDNFHSPTLATDMSPTSPTMLFHDILSSPVAARPSKSTQRNYNSLDNSPPGSCQPGVVSESDDTRETQQAGDVESPVMEDEIHEKKQFSVSPMEDQDTESEADDLINQGFGPTDKWFRSAGSPTKSPLSLHHTKRVRSLNHVKSGKANTTSSPSPTDIIGTEEKLGSYEALEQLPEGSIERSVAQLVLLLERFRRRMKSQAERRSSEILSAAADKIGQQLQNVEFQILADVQKFNNSGKSKKKCLESKFREQQERLRLIHDNFKEEIKQHLLDCSSKVDEFDAYNNEIKGAAQRQKASHKKLILQVKEETEARINDAETSIAAIHKDAREKMDGLKRVLKEWKEH